MPNDQDEKELLNQIEELLNEKGGDVSALKLQGVSAVKWKCGVKTGSDGKPVVYCEIGGSF